MHSDMLKKKGPKLRENTKYRHEARQEFANEWKKKMNRQINEKNMHV